MPHARIYGQRIYYQWHGRHHRDRATAVFLHDGLGSSASWKEIPRMIARRARLNALTYDRLGYGRSEPETDFAPGFMEREIPRLQALLDDLDLGSVHLIGHSDGGSIALAYASENRERVLSIVSVAAHTFVEDRTTTRIQELLQEAELGTLPRGMRKQHGRRARILLISWAQGWLTSEHARWDLRDRLAKISCPVFATQGDEDEFGTLAQLTSICESVPDAQRWVLSGCGHIPHHDHKDGFVARVVDFLQAASNQSRERGHS